MLLLFYSSKNVHHIMSPFCLKPSKLFPLDLSPNFLSFVCSSIILAGPGLFCNLVSYHFAPCSLYFSHTAFLSVPLKFQINSPCMVFEFAVFLAWNVFCLFVCFTMILISAWKLPSHHSYLRSYVIPYHTV